MRKAATMPQRKSLDNGRVYHPKRAGQRVGVGCERGGRGEQGAVPGHKSKQKLTTVSRQHDIYQVLL